MTGLAIPKMRGLRVFPPPLRLNENAFKVI